MKTPLPNKQKFKDDFCLRQKKSRAHLVAGRKITKVTYYLSSPCKTELLIASCIFQSMFFAFGESAGVLISAKVLIFAGVLIFAEVLD